MQWDKGKGVGATCGLIRRRPTLRLELDSPAAAISQGKVKRAEIKGSNGPTFGILTRVTRSNRNPEGDLYSVRLSIRKGLAERVVLPQAFEAALRTFEALVRWLGKLLLLWIVRLTRSTSWRKRYATGGLRSSLAELRDASGYELADVPGRRRQTCGLSHFLLGGGRLR